ncbi:MAG TPA: porin family protein [Pyrinomonadaceae bacterium]|jgi:opacity protein-like surface antigen|nr:porin family protein [Pyrinomonadaceae bacterium]
MRKALFTALFFVFCAPLAFAQGDFQRGEFGVMYSHNLVDTGGAFNNDPTDTGRDGFNGVNIDAGYNFTRYFGAKVDFSYHKKSNDVTFTGGTFNIDGKLTQFMGGVKIQDNAVDTKVRPFAQLLVGVGRVEIEGAGTGLPVPFAFDDSETGFAAAVGGGLDIRVHKNVDIRAIKVEYNPVRVDGATDNNIRIGVGLNFRF